MQGRIVPRLPCLVHSRSMLKGMVTVAKIQCAFRLIQKQQLRIRGQCAGQNTQLLLALAQMHVVVPFPACQPHLRTSPPGSGMQGAPGCSSSPRRA